MKSLCNYSLLTALGWGHSEEVAVPDDFHRYMSEEGLWM
jgi:hypothetical protein